MGLVEPSGLGRHKTSRSAAQREALLLALRTDLGATKLSADSHRRRAASTVTSPALSSGLAAPAALVRDVAAFRAGPFLLLATLFP
jgi:hypothetical protein